LGFEWLGRVHRGTPWQTIYLKSQDFLSRDLMAWQRWVGAADPRIAANLAPFNDWRIANLWNSLVTTNDPQQLLSVTNPDTNAWLALFDGLTAETNDPALLTRTTVIVLSNSAQAGAIVAGINRTRANLNLLNGPVFPNQSFHSPADVLATPELSDASPFLDLNGLQQMNAAAISDEAMEAIPIQLLPWLRADSTGLFKWFNGQPALQFAGDDAYAYAIESSSNLVNWLA
jgi:hypothetical protein